MILAVKKVRKSRGGGSRAPTVSAQSQSPEVPQSLPGAGVPLAASEKRFLCCCSIPVLTALNSHRLWDLSYGLQVCSDAVVG